MPYVDIVLVGIIAAFGLFGLWFGLVSTLGSIAGTVLGVYLASRFYMIPADWLMKITGWTGNFSKVIAFIIGFLIINRAVGIGFYLLDKLLFIVTSLPIIHGLNKILGLIFGLFEGILIIGIILFFVERFPLWPAFMSMLAFSKVAPFCVNIASLLWPLLPEALKLVRI